MLENDESLSQRIRVMQVILMAQVLGLLAFLGVVLFLVYGQNQGQGVAAGPAMPFLSYLAGGVLLASAFLGTMIPYFMAQAAMQRLQELPSQGDTEQDRVRAFAHLLTVRQSSLLVAQALFEGAGFLGCLAFLLEKQSFVVLIVGVALFLLLAGFPTRQRIQDWLERKLNLLKEQEKNY